MDAQNNINKLQMIFQFVLTLMQIMLMLILKKQNVNFYMGIQLKHLVTYNNIYHYNRMIHKYIFKQVIFYLQMEQLKMQLKHIHMPLILIKNYLN